MAVLAIPAIEAAVVRTLIALGVGAAASEAARQASQAAAEQRKAAEKAAVTPLAKADACTKSDTRKACKDCAPDRGAPFQRSTAGWSEVSIAYQARIAGLPVGPGFITEWLFNGVTFDGFDSNECLLKEAKAKYDQFFDEFGYRRDFWKGDEALLAQAVTQSTVAVPQPPVQLRWYFMEPLSYRYFSKIFSAAKLRIETVYQP